MCSITNTVSGGLVEILYVVSITAVAGDKIEQKNNTQSVQIKNNNNNKKNYVEESVKYKPARW